MKLPRGVALLVYCHTTGAMSVIIKALQMKGLNTAIAVISPKIVCFLIVITHLLRDQDLTADQVCLRLSFEVAKMLYFKNNAFSV